MKTVLPGQGFRFELDGRSLTIEDVVAFSRRSEYASCALSAEAVEKITATRALKRDLIGREVPIYGVTTGFGDSAHRQISASKTARLQQNMLRFLGSGTGPIASPEVTRAAMLLRANCLARGNSGVRLELVERLLFYLNNDVLPLIPERGSCGASGDLVPLSYVGAALVGEVEVLHDGEVKDSKELLGELGLEPLELEAKEGLALTNGTSFMSAFAALAVWDAEELALVSDMCSATGDTSTPLSTSRSRIPVRSRAYVSSGTCWRSPSWRWIPRRSSPATASAAGSFWSWRGRCRTSILFVARHTLTALCATLWSG